MSLPSDNYFVFIQDANLCLKSESFSINQPSAFSPIVDVIDIDGCYGDATGAINFSLSGNTPPYSYSWSNNQTTASISDLSSGDYEIIVNDDNNCQMTYSYFIDEPLALELSYTVMPASCEEKNDGAINTFVLGGIPPILYQWGSGEISSDISDISIGNYSLYVEDAMGCSLPIELIEVGFDGYNGCIEIPSGFTPNNDNIHDEWVIYGLYDFPNTIVKVYNRWGQEVFSSNGYNVPWDGKYNGVDLPTATYYYVIELNDSEKVYNGTVTIKR
jgi:gliding motility-associated-like protein